MTIESGAARRGARDQSVVCDRHCGRGDARRALHRQPVPAQFGRRDRARSRRRDRAHADRDRAALQHLFLRLRGDAIAARRGARPLRPEALHAGVDRLHGAGLRAVRGGARGRRPGRRPRAARLRHRFVPDGAGRALCALVSAGAVLDLRRHPARPGLARRDLRDRAAGLRHRELRLAHDVSRRRRLRRADRRAGLADRHRRSARREIRRRARRRCAKASPASGR